jgi:hypothetical protein
MSVTRTSALLGVPGATLRTTTSSGRMASVTGCPGPGLRSSAQARSSVPRRTVPASQHHGGQEIGGADKVSDKRAGGLPVDLQRRADLLDHALVHHHNAVGHGQRFFLIVRHHDGGHAQALVQAPDFGAQVAAHRASSALSGSSSSGKPGDSARARASATRCCWPPDNWAGYLRPESGSPTQPQQLIDPRGDLDLGQLRG